MSNLSFYQPLPSRGPAVDARAGGNREPYSNTTPFQAYNSAFVGSGPSNTVPNYQYSNSFAPPGVSGQMNRDATELTKGWLAAFSTEGYPGEPPLLEELGVNFDHIKSKTLAVLNPFKRINQNLMDDSDLAGPILFAVLFGFFLRASGNVHFGYVYGLSVLGSTSLHVILSLMAPPPGESIDTHVSPVPMPGMGLHDMAGGSTGPLQTSRLDSTLTYPRSASVLGYCLLPLVLTSMMGVAMSLDSSFGYLVTIGAVLWCTYSSSAMFCAVGRMNQMRGLVAYPLGLFYVCFGIMTIFSSRGAGAGAAGAAQF